jgi:hypothetical protein
VFGGRSYGLAHLAVGYDLHITGAPVFWGDNRGYEITEPEWLALVAADPTCGLRHLRSVLREGLVLWARQFEDYTGPWLCWLAAHLFQKPNAAIVGKMLELAQLLQARVQGDDSEVYLSDGRVQKEDGEFAGVDWRTQ